jgi:hypothetical protein
MYPNKSICDGLSLEDCIKLIKSKHGWGKTNKLKKGKNLNISVRQQKAIVKAKPQTKRKLKISEKTIEERKMNKMKNEKAKIIQNFMKKTKHTRKAYFLKAVCSDAGECLAFGNYTSDIKKHFGGFANFEYAIAPITRIGAPSVNGFINQIEYEHRGYKSYAVLKSSINPNSDNLMYEYMVGQYINKLNKRFPCFVETYGYYIYNTALKLNDKTVSDFLKDTKVTGYMNTIKKGLILQKTTDYAKACNKSKYLAILIQHLKGIISIEDKLRSSNFVKYELANVLFQVYYPLSLLGNTFTHYDLHTGNVNVYEPKKDSYIQFHYHIIVDKVFSFKSKYIAKIIDYGRSYFKDEEAGIDSKKIYTDLCKEPKCDPGCGYSKGFSWMYDNPNPSSSSWVNSQKRNKSHDLRLLKGVKEGTEDYQTDQYLSRGLKSLLQRLKYDHDFGTPEMIKQGYPNKILNIKDAAQTLANIILIQSTNDMNEEEYRGKTKLGDLHIYVDGTGKPMRFVKA